MKLLVFDDDTPGHVEIGLAAASEHREAGDPGQGDDRAPADPPHPATVRFHGLLWIGAKGDLSSVKQLPDPAAHCNGGPRAGPRPHDRGRAREGRRPLCRRHPDAPGGEPLESLLRTSRWTSSPTAAPPSRTWSGDVWICSGIDDKLEKLTWKRFATGLYEPLGLKIVDDVVHVLGRDQITKLHDLNGDGEADYYETFCNLGVTMASYHAFHYDLQTTAPEFLLPGRRQPRRAGDAPAQLPAQGIEGRVGDRGGRGRLSRDERDGDRSNDEIVCADNEGNWMRPRASTWVKKGGFYGFVSDPAHTNASHPAPKVGEPDPPLCWIRRLRTTPRAARSGSPATNGGRSRVICCIRPMARRASSTFCLRRSATSFRAASSSSRSSSPPASCGRASTPSTASSTSCGLRGWQTAGVRDGALQRVRYTGKPLRTVAELAVVKDGVALTFTDALDPETAADAGSYAVQQWNYLWSARYGSPDFSVADPKKIGRDTSK